MNMQPQSSLAETPRFSWRGIWIAGLRVSCGLIWAVDAWFTWQPDFLHAFTTYQARALEGQPPTAAAWITFWITVVQINPHIFAYALAIGETAVALGLIFGAFSNLMNTCGIVLSSVIWATAQAFGGYHIPGSTDIDSVIINTMVFVALSLANAGMYYGLDQWLSRKMGGFSPLTSTGRTPSTNQPHQTIPPDDAS